MRSRIVMPGLAVLLLVSTAVAVATGLPKLPKDLPLPQAADSPGQVVFSHVSHVDSAKPACTSCHPKLFKMLSRGTATPAGTITHASMEKGQQCGVCHNGKDAHGFDDCASCHRS